MSRKRIWLVLAVLALAVMACNLSAQQENGGAASGDIDGERMFENFGCEGCHEDSGNAPSLVGIYGKEEELEDGSTVAVDDAYLRESILDPKAKIVKGYSPSMPSFDAQLDDEEVGALIEYIRSLE